MLYPIYFIVLKKKKIANPARKLYGDISQPIESIGQSTMGRGQRQVVKAWRDNI